MPDPMMQAGAAPVPPQVPPGPQAAPMAQPSPDEGNMQMGMVQVESAMQLLEQALPALGSTSEEGAVVLKAMSLLAKVFNRPQAQELIPAQIAELARAQAPSALQQMMTQGGGGAAPPM